jgi:hypothetical protein
MTRHDPHDGTHRLRLLAGAYAICRRVVSHRLGMGIDVPRSCRAIRGQGSRLITRSYHHRLTVRFLA